jgi:hypothetical protein
MHAGALIAAALYVAAAATALVMKERLGVQ